jgi:hypothetical protein
MVTTVERVSSGKAVIRKALFSIARIDRIHIIGCARSGTTMLHLAMACFWVLSSPKLKLLLAILGF